MIIKADPQLTVLRVSKVDLLCHVICAWTHRHWVAAKSWSLYGFNGKCRSCAGPPFCRAAGGQVSGTGSASERNQPNGIPARAAAGLPACAQYSSEPASKIQTLTVLTLSHVLTQGKQLLRCPCTGCCRIGSMCWECPGAAAHLRHEETAKRAASGHLCGGSLRCGTLWGCLPPACWSAGSATAGPCHPHPATSGQCPHQPSLEPRPAQSW